MNCKRNRVRKNVLAAAVSALAIPSIAAASSVLISEWSYEPLYDDWHISSVMDAAVYSSDGENVGEVHDIIFGATGLIDTIVVEKRQEGTLDWKYYEVAWGETEFFPADSKVRIDHTASTVGKFKKSQVANFADSSEMEASNLIGMSVNLDGEFPYGEIDDLLVSAGANDLSAFIVESDGIGAIEYAIPADFDAVDYDSMLVELPYDMEALEALERFYIIDDA